VTSELLVLSFHTTSVNNKQTFLIACGAFYGAAGRVKEILSASEKYM
jgi:hypothetical protein